MINRGVRGSRRQRARMLFDRLPTKWLVTSVGAVLLALSAVVGGLDDAPVLPVPVIQGGDSHAGTELTIVVNSALLIDAFPEQSIVPEEGNRLLVVRATVENTTTEPRRLASGTTADTDSIGIAGIPGLADGAPPERILVIDDGSDSVVVQPGVPVELAYLWEIADDAAEAGDPVTVNLMDRDYISEGRLTYGGLYGDPVVGATLDVALGDVGAGVNQ